MTDDKGIALVRGRVNEAILSLDAKGPHHNLGIRFRLHNSFLRTRIFHFKVQGEIEFTDLKTSLI